MSTNLHIEGTRPAFYRRRDGSIEEFETHVSFSLWQTPTKVTWSIAGLPTFAEQLDAYCAWVLERSEDEVEPIYDWTELDGDFSPKQIGTKVVNYGADHVKKLRQWIEDKLQIEYNLAFSAV